MTEINSDIILKRRLKMAIPNGPVRASDIAAEIGDPDMFLSGTEEREISDNDQTNELPIMFSEFAGKSGYSQPEFRFVVGTNIATIFNDNDPGGPGGGPSDRSDGWDGNPPDAYDEENVTTNKHQTVGIKSYDHTENDVYNIGTRLHFSGNDGVVDHQSRTLAQVRAIAGLTEEQARCSAIIKDRNGAKEWWTLYYIMPEKIRHTFKDYRNAPEASQGFVAGEITGYQFARFSLHRTTKSSSPNGGALTHSTTTTSADYHRARAPYAWTQCTATLYSDPDGSRSKIAEFRCFFSYDDTDDGVANPGAVGTPTPVTNWHGNFGGVTYGGNTATSGGVNIKQFMNFTFQGLKWHPYYVHDSLWTPTPGEVFFESLYAQRGQEVALVLTFEG